MKLGKWTAIVLWSLIFIPAACDSPGKKSPVATVQDSPVLFDHLVGTWRAPDGKNFERWTKKEDGNFSSVAFSVNGSDTSWNENANIYRENDKWVFENTVKDQNEGKAIKFVASLMNDNAVQFSNPVHDFPTDINYTIVSPDSVQAFIIGPNNKGGKDTIPFNYRRVR